MKAFYKINDAKHVVIVTNNKTFANANAFYSYILSKHKKVTLVCTEKIDENFSFLPWFDKKKENIPASAELTTDAQKTLSDTLVLFSFLKNSNVKINEKMATSLYAGLLLEYDAFKSDKCDSTVFAVASELIQLNAAYKTCNDFLFRRDSLALFRLKALLYKSMLLSADATLLKMYMNDDDLLASGASSKDAEYIMREALNIVHVENVTLYDRDTKNKILKSTKEM